MKAVILAGGLGTRISEETHLKPKPMIEIGGRPILWHIMKLYSAHGVNDFVICCGYKGYVIKEYFANYFLHMSDVTFDMSSNQMEVHQRNAEPWRVTLVDTGENTATGGRLKRVANYLKNEKAFCFTYGDGVGDVDISKLIDFHHAHGKLATVTAVSPPGRFGSLATKGTEVTGFLENFAIGNFIRDALWHDEITVSGDGTAVRSYLDQSDLAVWLMTLLEKGKPGRAYNVGSDKPIAIADLARLVRDTISPNKKVNIMGEPSATDANRSVYVPDITRAKEELGLGVTVALEDAIRNTAQAYQ